MYASQQYTNTQQRPPILYNIIINTVQNNSNIFHEVT